MLNSAHCPAIMIETFFCDNKVDYDIAQLSIHENLLYKMLTIIIFLSHR
jgi:hypothetical protein